MDIGDLMSIIVYGTFPSADDFNFHKQLHFSILGILIFILLHSDNGTDTVFRIFNFKLMIN